MGRADYYAEHLRNKFQSTHPVWDGTRVRARGQCVLRHFNPPIPCGMGHSSGALNDREIVISIHPSRVGWDLAFRYPADELIDFNPPIPCGMGPDTRISTSSSLPYFNPPIPCGMGLTEKYNDNNAVIFQSTHPVWDGTPPPHKRGQIPPISIHPSRVGWDKLLCHQQRRGLHFNPPIPCGMGLSRRQRMRKVLLFQSTHPVWDGTRATGWWRRMRRFCIIPSRVGWSPRSGVSGRRTSDFNPPIPCGMGHGNAEVVQDDAQISIHPSRVGWDAGYCAVQRPAPISIHPSRVGWDPASSASLPAPGNFNPPIPCGMGPGSAEVVPDDKEFQSTHPVWDGT